LVLFSVHSPHHTQASDTREHTQETDCVLLGKQTYKPVVDVAATRNAAYIGVTQAVADRHTDGQTADGQTLCDNKG